eukprot:scaffold1821_cov344-Pavlova_lutheri.AAC.5
MHLVYRGPIHPHHGRCLPVRIAFVWTPAEPLRVSEVVWKCEFQAHARKDGEEGMHHCTGLQNNQVCTGVDQEGRFHVDTTS